MKSKLQQDLASICPSVNIETTWTHDTDIHPDIRKDCDGMDDEDPADWQCWRSEVKASAIVNGEVITGSDYLGGTWERAGDYPWQSNPEISGYEASMTVAALEDLLAAIDDPELTEEISAAITHIHSLE